MTSQVAIEIFEAEYAQRSGTTVQHLHAWGRFGAPCDCGEPECEGFQMMHLRSGLIEAGWTPPVQLDDAANQNDVMTTYRRADRSEIMGEFTFVTDRVYLDEADHDEPTEYLAECWVFADRRSIWKGPPIVCTECGCSADDLYVPTLRGGVIEKPAGVVCCDGK